MSDETPAPPPQPAKVLTDEETVDRIIVQAIQQAPHGYWSQEMVRPAMLAAIQGERARCVSIVQTMLNQAHNAGRAGERAQNHELMAQAGIAAAALGHVIHAISLPPGVAVCPTCQGAKMVLSKVALAGGRQVPIPCPTCKPKTQEEAPVG